MMSGRPKRVDVRASTRASIASIVPSFMYQVSSNSSIPVSATVLGVVIPDTRREKRESISPPSLPLPQLSRSEMFYTYEAPVQ